MPQITKYVCVKVVIEVPEIIDLGDGRYRNPNEEGPYRVSYASQDELAEDAINECDYNFTYDGGDVRIVDTEIIGIQNHSAIGL